MCLGNISTIAFTALMTACLAFSLATTFYPASRIINQASDLVDDCSKNPSDPSCDQLQYILKADVIPFGCAIASIFKVLEYKQFSDKTNVCKDSWSQFSKDAQRLYACVAIAMIGALIGVIAGIITCVLFSCCACLRMIPMILLTGLGLIITVSLITYTITYAEYKSTMFSEIHDQLFPSWDVDSIRHVQSLTLAFGAIATVAAGLATVSAFLGIFTSLPCCC
uniref:Transmembrane protein n=1 Tax=Rhabditophanes sp. KR3021 TaxID=114890 RepID=A0AC35TK69_9BILA